MQVHDICLTTVDHRAYLEFSRFGLRVWWRP